MSTYSKMKQLDERQKGLTQSNLVALINELSTYFCNSVKYTDLDPNTPKDFITLGLLWDGCVGYVKHEEVESVGVPYAGWYRLRPTGFLNRWGYPNAYNLVYGNYEIAANNVPYDRFSVINANAKQFPYIIRFIKDCETITALDTSMLVNVQASRNADLIPVKNTSTVATIAEYYDSARNGAAAIVLDDDAAECVRNKVENKTPFMADKIDALRRGRWEELIRRCGIVSANNFKRERVQSAEVDASVGESVDYLYTMIDAFNYDCERQGIPTRMEVNGYVARYDE